MKGIVALMASVVLGCGTRAHGSAGLAPDEHARDEDLFPQVVAVLRSDSIGGPVRIDPRPIKADPGIISVQFIDMAPDVIEPVTTSAMLVDSPSVVRRRGETLRSIGAAVTDMAADMRCPGGVAPLTEEMLAKRKEFCPSRTYRSVLVAMPRDGGPFWPGNVDKRSDYVGRRVASVRILQKTVGPRGGPAVSYDLIFERDDAGTWMYVGEERYLVVE